MKIIETFDRGMLPSQPALITRNRSTVHEQVRGLDSHRYA